jgi:SAM-dependent methyltransferase
MAMPPTTPWNGHDYARDQGLAETRIRIRALHRRMLRGPAPGRILEVGLGSGDLTLMLTEAFVQDRPGRLTCLDAEPDTLQRVQGRLQARGLTLPEFICSLVERARLPPARFDHIVLFNILEHLPEPAPVLAALRLALAPAGRMHISVPLAGSLHRWLGVQLGLIDGIHQLAATDLAFGHHRVYDLPLLRTHVAAAGLAIRDEAPFYLKPLPTATLDPLPWELHDALDALGAKFPQFAAYVYLEAGHPASREYEDPPNLHQIY